MGVELETISEMKGDSLNDQVEDDTDFVEVLALETEPWTKARHQLS